MIVSVIHTRDDYKAVAPGVRIPPQLLMSA